MKDKNTLSSFLGTGWSFPPSFNRYDSSIKMVSDLEDICESILVILNTFPGERIMLPEFGCYLKQMVFESIDSGFLVKINETINKALLNFEPRVKEVNVEIQRTDHLAGLVVLNISFSIIITNTRHNIIYPFYFTEGTNVKENLI